jgi:hypothetical protein
MYPLDQIDIDNIQEKLDLSQLTDFIIHKDYSGRGMNGRKCFGIELQEGDSAWELAMALGGAADCDIDWMLLPPKVDNMGHNLIYYWPNVEVRDDSDDEDEDEDKNYADDVDIQNDRARE